MVGVNGEDVGLIFLWRGICSRFSTDYQDFWTSPFPPRFLLNVKCQLIPIKKKKLLIAIEIHFPDAQSTSRELTSTVGVG